MKPAIRPVVALLSGLLLAGTVAHGQAPAAGKAPRFDPGPPPAGANPPTAAAPPSSQGAGRNAAAAAGANARANQSPASTVRDTSNLPDLGSTNQARAGVNAAPASDAGATTDDRDIAADRPNGYPLRFRLDDGRYVGFHQDGGDQPASGTGLQSGNERLSPLASRGAPIPLR